MGLFAPVFMGIYTNYSILLFVLYHTTTSKVALLCVYIPKWMWVFMCVQIHLSRYAYMFVCLCVCLCVCIRVWEGVNMEVEEAVRYSVILCCYFALLP